MAVWKIVPLADLSAPAVLAPERYHPHRASLGRGVPLGELCTVENRPLTPARAGRRPRVVLDTGDANEGFIRLKPSESSIGSVKKSLATGDVLISRLRPYLRQIGFVDADLGEAVCSTEFFVLRARDERSIAFLVPFLLSEAPQRLFAASVEGGHHPRFRREALASLPVPEALLAERDALSLEVEAAIASRRQGERALQAALKKIEQLT